MKRVYGMVSGAVAVIGLAAAIGLVAGCEWESSGDSNSWSDAYNWVNFSGTYRSSTSGILVSAYTQKVTTTVTTSTSTQAGTSGESSVKSDGTNSSKTSSNNKSSSSSNNQSSNSSNDNSNTSSATRNKTSNDATDAIQVTTNVCTETLGKLAAQTLVAGGSVRHTPVVAGSMVISVGNDVVLADDGSGKLTGTGGSGTISYDGGGWSISLADPMWSASARTISANYAYTVTTRGPATQNDNTDVSTNEKTTKNGDSSQRSSGESTDTASGENTETTSGDNKTKTSESSKGNNTTSTTTTVDDGKRPGSTGGAIFALIVVQEGQHLTITDNNGGTYKGRIGTLRSSSGATPENSNSTGNGGKVLPKNGDTIVATFNCKGTSAAGMSVTITGTLSGTVSSRSSVDPGVFINRQMQGSWIEAGGKTGDINGTTDSIEIPKTEDSTWQWDMLPSEVRWPAGTEPGSSVITTPASTQATGGSTTMSVSSGGSLNSTQAASSAANNTSAANRTTANSTSANNTSSNSTN